MVGLPEEICEVVNKEMDAPSQLIPGCNHRKLRHQLSDCESIAQTFKYKMLAKGKSESEASRISDQARLACMLHIWEDCKEGSEACRKSLPCEEVKKELYDFVYIKEEIRRRLENLLKSS
jgi:hypothetical protein